MRVRRLLVAVLASFEVCGGVLWLSGTALAAAPEAPEVSVQAPVLAFTATFHGVLNPKEAAEPNNLGGTYRFLYKASKTECTGGSVTKPSGLWFGGVHEEVFKPVSGLTANTEYMVCLSVTNLEGETTVSAPVPFTTHSAPLTPETKPVPAPTITATSAELEGTLNPPPLGSATSKAGWYFAYREGSSCTGAGEQRTAQEPEVEGAGLPEKAGVTNLEPNKTYRVCLVATDEVGDGVPGNEVIVKTLAPPPVIVFETGPVFVAPSAFGGALEARLEAFVNPNDQVTECRFQYGTASVSEHEASCEQGSGSISGLDQLVSATLTGPSSSPASLALGGVYHYRVVLKNAKGEEVQGTENKQFETLGAPIPQTSAAEEVTTKKAFLGGQLDAGGEAEYWVEYGTSACAAESCGTKTRATFVTGKVQECTLGGVLKECVEPIFVFRLEPNTTYHYWLVATNAAVSKPVHGAAMEFTTKVAAPALTTGVAEDVTATSAQIPGELNPGGGETEYWVEVLLPSNTTVKTASAVLNGKTQASVGPIAITGLAPNTTYYYWIAAKNSAVSAPVHSQGRSFTTPSSQAEIEAQEAAIRRPAEQLAASIAARQRLQEEEAKRAQAAAVAAGVAKQRAYEEIAAQTALLARGETQAGKQPETGKAKPRHASCRKGYVKHKNKCVRAMSKRKGKVKK